MLVLVQGDPKELRVAGEGRKVSMHARTKGFAVVVSESRLAPQGLSRDLDTDGCVHGAQVYPPALGGCRFQQDRSGADRKYKRALGS